MVQQIDLNYSKLGLRAETSIVTLVDGVAKIETELEKVYAIEHTLLSASVPAAETIAFNPMPAGTQDYVIPAAADAVGVQGVQMLSSGPQSASQFLVTLWGV